MVSKPMDTCQLGSAQFQAQARPGRGGNEVWVCLQEEHYLACPWQMGPVGKTRKAIEAQREDGLWSGAGQKVLQGRGRNFSWTLSAE